MKMFTRRTFTVSALSALTGGALLSQTLYRPGQAAEPASKETYPVTKTPEEWKQSLTPEQYRSVMKGLGYAPQAGAITYCNTGHMAAGAWFVMSEIMGNPDTRLYDGSMHEWTTLGHPVVGVGL